MVERGKNFANQSLPTPHALLKRSRRVAEQRTTPFRSLLRGTEIAWRGTGAATGGRLIESFIACKKVDSGVWARLARRRSFFFLQALSKEKAWLSLSFSCHSRARSHGIPRALALLQQRALTLSLIPLLLGGERKEEQQCILLRCRRRWHASSIWPSSSAFARRPGASSRSLLFLLPTF